MNNKGQFSSISWRGGSVSGLVFIGGLIVYFFSDKFLGVLLMISGVVLAFFMSPIGRRLLSG